MRHALAKTVSVVIHIYLHWCPLGGLTYTTCLNSFLSPLFFWGILMVTTLCEGVNIMVVEVSVGGGFNDLRSCVLNDSSSMLCHPASGARSVLDVFMTDPSLFFSLSWTVVDDLCGSSHFTGIVQFRQPRNYSALIMGILTVVDPVRGVTSNETCKYGECGSFEHLFFLLMCILRCISSNKCSYRGLETVPWRMCV